MDGFITKDNVVTILIFVKVFMHSPFIVYVRSQSLIEFNSAFLCSSVLIKSVGGSDVFLYPMVIPLFFLPFSP